MKKKSKVFVYCMKTAWDSSDFSPTGNVHWFLKPHKKTSRKSVKFRFPKGHLIFEFFPAEIQKKISQQNLSHNFFITWKSCQDATQVRDWPQFVPPLTKVIIALTTHDIFPHKAIINFCCSHFWIKKICLTKSKSRKRSASTWFTICANVRHN